MNDSQRSSTPISIGLSWLIAHEEIIRRTAMLSLAYLVSAIWILQPIIIDPDIWWHLRTGKWIVEHGALPTTDPFSVFGEGKSWVVYSWLFDVLMYGLVSIVGERGILLYTLALSLLILLTLHGLLSERVKNFAVLCAALAVCSIALVKVFTPRPWLWTIVGVALTLNVILTFREGKICRWYWLLPAVYALWVNIHVQFVVGLGLLGLACLAPILDHIVRSYSTKGLASITWNSGQWRKLLVLTIICGFATLANPYHLHVYSIVIDYTNQAGFKDVISEMQAPTFRSLADWAMLGVFSYSLFMLGRQSSYSSFDVLFLGIAAYLSFQCQREAWLLIVASVSIIRSSQSGEAISRFPDTQSIPAVPVIFSVGMGVVCLIGYLGTSNDMIRENTAQLYPERAARFLETNRYDGNIYNHFDWGGYLIWRLPHLKVSVDGRGHVHGDTRVKQGIHAWNGGPHWKEDEDLNMSNIVMAKKEAALTEILRLDTRFYVAYEDNVAVVFIRSEQ